jgi:uncharacterized membrane protein
MTTTLPRPATTEAAPPRTSLRPWYALMLVGGALGLFTAGWQTVERIAWAADPTASSVCEINAVLSCSSVFSHWQSSALGVPNSLIAMAVFGVIASAGLAGLLGSRLSRSYLATVFGVTVFMTAFVVWYLEQSALSIGVLCLFCVGCAVNIIVAGVGVTRVAAGEEALGRGRLGRGVAAMVGANADVVAWVGLAALLTLVLVLGLTL